uniref:Uncharacterized protein n=1 Tax=Zooxanthella nutricula TaxID=1333877 RepID=A0A6U6N8W2_9DINO|mmetsp:Transcript_44724/g.135660  ORF Transcript_44724/g.135660 Transcript_44724/m.135660 type:complete len:476 (+) Transcript_44724:99-1526(+)
MERNSCDSDGGRLGTVLSQASLPSTDDASMSTAAVSPSSCCDSDASGAPGRSSVPPGSGSAEDAASAERREWSSSGDGERIASKTSQASLPSTDDASLDTRVMSPSSCCSSEPPGAPGRSSVSSGGGFAEVQAHSAFSRGHQSLTQGACLSARPAFSRHSSPGSVVASRAASDCHFSEPAQTLIFLDWDDTLFPTTEIVDRWGVSIGGERGPYVPKGPEQAAWLEQWRLACRNYLQRACSMSNNCCIVTNARRPWVDECLACFFPELQELVDKPGGPRVVYAHESLAASKRRSPRSGLRPLLKSRWVLPKTAEEVASDLTSAKYVAMRTEAAAFYSQYPSQSWKNIISIGDMLYERDAMQDLSLRRAPHGRERLRTKTLVLPRHPTLSEIAMRLHAAAALLPLEVAFNGDIDVDLNGNEDPLQAMGHALALPGLATLPISRHAWGLAPAPRGQEEVEQTIAELTVFVHEALYGDR